MAITGKLALDDHDSWSINVENSAKTLNASYNLNSTHKKKVPPSTSKPAPNAAPVAYTQLDNSITG